MVCSPYLEAVYLFKKFQIVRGKRTVRLSHKHKTSHRGEVIEMFTVMTREEMISTRKTAENSFTQHSWSGKTWSWFHQEEISKSNLKQFYFLVRVTLLSIASIFSILLGSKENDKDLLALSGVVNFQESTKF